jgi:hypothetical protein
MRSDVVTLSLVDFFCDLCYWKSLLFSYSASLPLLVCSLAYPFACLQTQIRFITFPEVLSSYLTSDITSDIYIYIYIYIYSVILFCIEDWTIERPPSARQHTFTKSLYEIWIGEPCFRAHVATLIDRPIIWSVQCNISIVAYIISNRTNNCVFGISSFG